MSLKDQPQSGWSKLQLEYRDRIQIPDLFTKVAQESLGKTPVMILDSKVIHNK